MGDGGFFYRELFYAFFQRPVRKVNDGGGIDIDFAITDFEVEMRCRGFACAASQSDDISGIDVIVDFLQSFGQVSVNGLEPVLVFHDDVVPVSARIVPGHDDSARQCGNDRFVLDDVHVDTPVQAVVADSVGGAD